MASKERISYAKFEEIMREYNRRFPENADMRKLSGVIVYKPDNWPKAYSEESRSYRVWNCNRHYQDGKIANSLFGNCLDGTDIGVRLDWYNWTVDYCYMD